MEKEIAQLKKDIEYEEYQYNQGLEYPTDTDQFRRGMEKSRTRISDMKEKLKELEKSQSINPNNLKVGDIISVYYTNKKPKRTDAQKRYYFEYLSLISLSCGHSVEELHTWVKGNFLSKGIKEVFGHKVRVVRSINELNISEMSELIEKIEEITEIPAPPTDLFKLPHSHQEHEKLKREQTTLYSSLTVSKKLKIKTT